MPDEAKLTLEENLLLFYTGVRRSASDEIAAQFDEGAAAVDRREPQGGPRARPRELPGARTRAISTASRRC